MPTLATNNYRWLDAPFVPPEEFPSQLTPENQTLGAGGQGSVALYTTPEGIGLAAKSASGPDANAVKRANRALRREVAIYGRLKAWADKNKTDWSHAIFQKNVVKIYGMAEVRSSTGTDATQVLLMEKGYSGLAVIKEVRLQYASGKLTKPQFDGIMQLIGYEALEVIDLFGKAKILHGDMKFDNVIFDRKTGDLKVIDFGLSGDLGDHTCNGTSTFAPPGTVGEHGFWRAEPFDVFCLASSLIESMEIDLTNFINDRWDQWDFKHQKNWQPNEGLTFVKHGDDVVHTNPFTVLKERVPGHYIDIRKNVNEAEGTGSAYTYAMKTMQNPFDQAPSARAAKNLPYFQAPAISHVEARSLIVDIMDALDPVDRSAKQDHGDFRKRENLPPGIDWIATKIDLLKGKYKLECAAQAKGKHASDTIRELMQTCTELLNNLNAASNHRNNTDLHNNAVALLRKELDEQHNNIASLAIRTMSELAKVETNLPAHLLQFASEVNARMAELAALSKQLPKDLQPVVLEACALLLQQKKLNIALNLTPSEASESDKPIDLKLAPHRWHYRAALQARRRCGQLIQVLNSVAMNPSQNVMQIVINKAKSSLKTKLNHLHRGFSEIATRMAPTDGDKQKSAATHLLFQNELEVQLLIEQSEALLAKMDLAPQKTTPVTRRVQMMIDTLVKHDARIDSMLKWSAAEPDMDLKVELDATIGRLEKSKQNISRHLEIYREPGVGVFHGTEKRINKLLSEIFSIPGSTFKSALPDKHLKVQDFVLANETWAQLKNLNGRTDSDVLTLRKELLADLNAFAPRMATFVARMRPLLEELGLSSDFEKNRRMEENKTSMYMPKPLHDLRERVRGMQADYASNTMRPGLMYMVKFAEDYLAQFGREDMEVIARAVGEREKTPEEREVLHTQEKRKNNLQFPDPLDSKQMKVDSAANPGELDMHKRAHVRRTRQLANELELLKHAQKTSSGNDIQNAGTLSVEFSVDYAIERDDIGEDLATLLARADDENEIDVEANKLADLRKHGVIPENNSDAIDLIKLNDYLAVKASPKDLNEIQLVENKDSTKALFDSAIASLDRQGIKTAIFFVNSAPFFYLAEFSEVKNGYIISDAEHDPKLQFLEIDSSNRQFMGFDTHWLAEKHDKEHEIRVLVIENR